MAHWNQILDFMQEHGSITPDDALTFKPHKCTRLASRIHDLKDMGYPVVKTMETKKYDDGTTVTYARYHLEDCDEQRTVS